MWGRGEGVRRNGERDTHRGKWGEGRGRSVMVSLYVQYVPSEGKIEVLVKHFPIHPFADWRFLLSRTDILV